VVRSIDEERAVTIQEVTDGQRFCVHCGTALVGGRCPLHGLDVSNRNRPSTSSVPPSVHNNAWSAAPVEASWQRQGQRQPQSQPALRIADPRPPRRARAGGPGVTWVVAGVGVFLLIALIADHLTLQHAIDANHRTFDQRLAAQVAATNALSHRVGDLESKSPDVVAVAKLVRASVFTIDTPDGLGSGWVVSSAGGSSVIVTDYHVVQSVWTGTKAHTVQVKQEGKSLTGTITKVDMGDDLAVVTVKQSLTALARATTEPAIGDAVVVVGSPLGLSGTVATGIVSSFRAGLIQFSAPISPGDSGGPVVNQQGLVIGVAESKLVGSGVEGLSFAIPITTVCSTVATC
jgi:putative serine protease PepD